MSSSSTTPAPGWYPDPKEPAQRRYWDGSQWTTRVDRPDSAAPAKPKLPKLNGLQLMWAYILATAIPLAGFVAGTMASRRDQDGHGVALWVVGFISMLIYIQSTQFTY